MHWFGVRGIAMSTSLTSVVALAVTYAAIVGSWPTPAGEAPDELGRHFA